MAIRTGTSAKLQILGENNRTYINIAKVVDLTINVSRNMLETTALEDEDRNYVYGLRETSGSGTLLYDSDDQGTVSLMNKIFDDNEELTGLKLVLNTSDPKAEPLAGDVLLTSLGVRVSVGDTIKVPVSFKFSGKPTGEF